MSEAIWEPSEFNGYLRCPCCKDCYILEEWLEDGKWNFCPTCGAPLNKPEGKNEKKEEA